MPKKAGRPSKLTRQLAQDICALIAERYSLRQIQDIKGMPNKSTILRWNFEDGEIYKEFQDLYARALIIRAHSWAEEIIDISDDGRNDWEERESKNGNTFIALNQEHVQRSRLRVDSRKFLLAKMLPRLYGDKVEAAPLEAPEGDIILERGADRKSQIVKQEAEGATE